MSEYLSGRKRNLNIGIRSYTESDLVLDVIGNANVSGITTLASSGGITTTGGDLYVNGNLYAKNSVRNPIKLSDLIDVEISNNLDKYVLMYDSGTQKWRDVNPDEVLIGATNDQTPGYVGMPSVFIDKLDEDLDNKIDVDAGDF